MLSSNLYIFSALLQLELKAGGPKIDFSSWKWLDQKQ